MPVVVDDLAELWDPEFDDDRALLAVAATGYAKPRIRAASFHALPNLDEVDSGRAI